MKTFLGLSAAALLFVGCETAHDMGPYLSQPSRTPPFENTEPIVLLDPGVAYSVNCPGLSARQLDDGRLEILAQLRNRENYRVEVQANCVFKDLNGFSVGDETPFKTVILTENATEQIRFVSANDLAKTYTIRVRVPR